MKKYLLMVVLVLCGIVALIADLPAVTKILVVIACAFGIYEVSQISDDTFRSRGEH